MDKNNKRGSTVVEFLRDYQRFGSRGHYVSANALKERMNTSGDSDERKLLVVKIFREFVAAQEDLGALCIAIKHRNDELGLIYGYLTYGQTRNSRAPQTSLKGIFEAFLDGRALGSALNLPSLEDILTKLPELSESILPQLYRETNNLLAQVAKAYLYDDRAFVRVYNKTKHGFAIISDEDIFSPKTKVTLPSPGCWIVVESQTYDLSQDDPQRMVELCLTEENQVEPMIVRIGTIRGAVRTLCELTAFLLEKGLITSRDK